MGIMNRVFVPFLIISLPVAAMLAYLAYYAHEKRRLPPVSPMVEPIGFGGDQWAVFRSDAALTGTVEGQLPDSLVLAWRFETADAVKSTPAASGGMVFVSSMDGHLYAVDLALGQVQWRFEADDALQAAPLIADGVAYVGSERGTFYAIDAADGSKRWTFATRGKIIGAANTFQDVATGRRRIVFGGYDNYLYCLDAETGDRVWQQEAQSYINGAAAIADGAAVFGSCDGRLYIVPLDEPEQGRTVDIEAYMAASPAIEDGVIFAGNYEGLFQAARLEDGRILWQFRQEGVPFVSSPAVSADRVLFGARDKTLYCLNRQDGTQVWTFAATAGIDSSPVVCGDKVIFGSDNGRLYVVGLNDGRERFSYALGGAVSAGPAVVDSTVLVGCEDGSVYAFRAAP